METVKGEGMGMARGTTAIRLINGITAVDPPVGQHTTLGCRMP